ncbi:MAG: DUF4238 domain-containing protein [Paludibacter sp.]|nr:DUF4238 domain-containing protein [Paludibacter sp.]
MEESWRHHYLPQFYIKGFCDENGTITVYNKQYRKFEKKSPKYIFFEANRNTFFDALGNQGDTLEKLYGYLESTISPHLNNAINNTTGVMEVETLRNLIFLAYLTKWRNPQYDESFEDLKENYTIDDLGLGLIANGEKLDIELEEFFLSDLSQECKRLFLSIQPFRFKDDYKVIFKNSFIIPSSAPCLLGDCPFLEANIDGDRVFEDFIFPISQNQRLVYSNRINKYEFVEYCKNNESKACDFIQLFSTVNDLTTFYLSEKYVACANEEYLKDIVAKFDDFKKLYNVNSLTHQTFSVFHNYNT